MNLYGFVLNSPLNYLDPNGLDVWDSVKTGWNESVSWGRDRWQSAKEFGSDAWMRAQGTWDNAVFFRDWFFEKGADQRFYTDGHRLTELLKRSNGIERAMAQYKLEGCPQPPWRYGYGTMQGYKDFAFQWGFLNPAETQIGGYILEVTGSTNGQLTIRIENHASWRSLLGEPVIRGKYVQGKNAVEGVVNPLISNLNQYSPWSVPSLNIPVWSPWPIHTRPRPGQPSRPTDVEYGGDIEQEFVFKMKSPCCP